MFASYHNVGATKANFKLHIIFISLNVRKEKHENGNHLVLAVSYLCFYSMDSAWYFSYFSSKHGVGFLVGFFVCLFVCFAFS